MNGMLNIEREIFIAASPETVFRFFVEPALMARWFGQQHTLDPRPGGIFRVEVTAGKIARGTYTEITPHRRVAFTWGWEGRDDLPPGRSLVEIEFVAQNRAPCSDFDTAASRQWRRHRSRQRSIGTDGRTTWCDSKKQCAIPASHERRKL
jgi:uncharacterized protein YndB with AHSA1/START domain